MMVSRTSTFDSVQDVLLRPQTPLDSKRDLTALQSITTPYPVGNKNEMRQQKCTESLFVQL